MLQVTAQDVVASPFPHVVSDAILAPDLFAGLKADFPDALFFESAAGDTGSSGSRAGKGTGFDIYRGDSAYDRLIATSAAWAEFDGFINSRSFVDAYQTLFGRFGADIGISADIENSRYDRDYIEPRSMLTESLSVKERVSGIAHRMTRGMRTNRTVDLFTRLDITRSLGGYAKRPHTDRPNRLCSLILYFTDADDVGLEGGDLLIYLLKKGMPVKDAPRHPRPEDVDIVATLRPKANRGVFFPCCNTSYHGVTAVTSSGVPRDFLYLNISGDVASLW